MFNVVDDTVPSCFRANEASSPTQPFPSEHTHKFVSQFLISTKHESNLPSPGSDITSRYIRVPPNMLRELSHEAHAEPPNLVVRFAFGIEIATPFSSAHGEAGKGIFEGLFETEEFEDGKVDRGMKSETTFVRTKRRIVLQTTR